MATRKKSTAAAVTGNTVTEDIHHEEVPVTDKATPVEGILLTVEDQIKQELVKFNLADQGIALLKETYGALTINGQDDKIGYKAVKEAWGIVRSKRTGLEKKGKELRADYQVITKAIGGEEKRLVELITPLEEDLYNKWKAIDDEKERQKKEAEEAEQKRLMDRIEEVQTLGMTFADGFYQIGGTITVDVASLRQFNDEQYGKLKQAITNKKAELDKAEADRLENERKERERMEQEKTELRKERREVRIGKLELLGMEISGTGDDEVVVFKFLKLKTVELLDLSTDDWNKQLQNITKTITDWKKEQADRELRATRISKVKELGFVQKGENFFFDNGHKTINHGIASLIELDEYGFGEHFKILEGMVNEANQAKAEHEENQRKEQLEKDRREKFIAESLEAVGMSWNFSRNRFEWVSTELDPIIATWNDFAGMDDAAITTKASQLGTQISSAKSEETRIIAERKVETDKQEKLGLDDKTRYAREHAMIAGAASNMIPTEFKTKKYKDRSQQFLDRLINLLKEFE